MGSWVWVVYLFSSSLPKPHSLIVSRGGFESGWMDRLEVLWREVKRGIGWTNLDVWVEAIESLLGDW